MRYNPYYTRPQKQAAMEDIGAATTGAISGAQSGGAVGAGVGAALGLYGSTIGRIGAANNLANADTGLDLTTNYDPSVDPSYSGQQYSQAQDTLAELSEAEQGLKGTGGKMALLGIAPALIAGGFSRRARTKLQDKQNQIRTDLRTSQNSFNEASQGFEQREVAQEQYRRNRNRSNRLYNLYSATGQQTY